MALFLLPRIRNHVCLSEVKLKRARGGLPLFTELPVSSILGNRTSGFLHSRNPGLPYARRSFGICQSAPRVGKHYQNYDEDSHYLQHCDKGLQCDAWRKDYPRRSQKEVERTNNDGGPVAPWFEHPQSDGGDEAHNAQNITRVNEKGRCFL